jgi:hypothetical protein
MDFKTIGVGGQLANGKDELANYLATRLNELCKEPWKRNAFANKVKETFERAFGKDREFIEQWKRLEMAPPGFKKNVRQCLIGIGDGFRQMQPNIWIEQAFADQDAHQIISDCRYINETKHIRERDGVTILLWREGHMNNMESASEQEYMPFLMKCLHSQLYSSAGEDNWVPFEGEIGPAMEIPFDLFIRNDGDLNKLKQKVDAIVIPFLRRKWTDLFKA